MSIIPCLLVWQGVCISGKNAVQLKIATGCCQDLQLLLKPFFKKNDLFICDTHKHTHTQLFQMAEYFSPLWLVVKPLRTCACECTMPPINSLSERLLLQKRMLGISAMPGLLLPFLSASVHPQACALFTKRDGGWTPFTHKEEEEKKTKMRYR